MIRKYSQLKLAATEEEQFRIYLDLFKKRAEKLKVKNPTVVFDPDVVGIDIQRWQLQHRKKNPEVKNQIEQYRDHVELHAAMRSFRTEDELSLESEQQSAAGTKVLFQSGDTVAYEVNTPQALSRLSQGSHWCVQNVSTAQKFLKDLGPFIIVHVEGKPYIAICGSDEQIWWWTDYDLRNGTDHAQYPADIMQVDFAKINMILAKLGKPELVPEHFDVYLNVEDYKQKMLGKGDFARIIFNNRWEPEIIRDLIPPGTTLQGNLVLESTPITSLPEGLSIKGGLYLSDSEIKSLPEGLSVGGNLVLVRTPITSLPERLSVGGDLNLTKTSITSLPEGLSVGGSLYLENTPITSLPEGLSVGRHLNLMGSKITSLPEGLTINGNLNLGGTPITTLPEGLKVQGYLYLLNSKITSFPKGVWVGGGLHGINPKTQTPYQDEYDAIPE